MTLRGLGLTAGEQPMPKWGDYEKKIRRPLFELATAQEPKAVAAKYDLDYYAMVRVEIELEPHAPLPEGYLIEAEMRSDHRVQALVRLDQLLELSQQPGIKEIRSPRKPIPR